MDIRRIAVAVTAAVALGSAARLAAADGDLDSGFGDAGKRTRGYPFGGEVESVRITVESGGGVVAATRLDSQTVGIVRFESNGDSDTGFGSVGGRSVSLRTPSGSWDELPGLHVTPAGAILVVGTGLSEGTFAPRVARLTAAGDLDLTFDGDGYADVTDLPGTESAERDFAFRASAIDRQGRILLAGQCNLCPANVDTEAFVVRLLANGAPDPNFGVGGWRVFDPTESDTDDALELEIDDLDRVYVRGNGINPNLPFVARLTANGNLDGTWGDSGVGLLSPADVGFNPTAMAWDPSTGGLVLAHGADGVNGRPTGVLRVTAGGLFDATFAGDGFVDLSGYDEGTYIEDVLVQSDGRIAAVGTIDGNGTQLGGFFLARLLTTGALDSSFDGNGVKRVEFDLVPDGFDEALAVALSGGRLVVAGRATELLQPAQFALLRTENAVIFVDRFERGSSNGWTATVP